MPTSKVGEGKDGEREGRGRMGKGRGEEGRGGPYHFQKRSGAFGYDIDLARFALMGNQNDGVTIS